MPPETHRILASRANTLVASPARLTAIAEVGDPAEAEIHIRGLGENRAFVHDLEIADGVKVLAHRVVDGFAEFDLDRIGRDPWRGDILTKLVSRTGRAEAAIE